MSEANALLDSMVIVATERGVGELNLSITDTYSDAISTKIQFEGNNTAPTISTSVIEGLNQRIILTRVLGRRCPL